MHRPKCGSAMGRWEGHVVTWRSCAIWRVLFDSAFLVRMPSWTLPSTRPGIGPYTTLGKGHRDCGLKDSWTCQPASKKFCCCLLTRARMDAVVHGLHLSKNSPLSVGVLLERWLGRRLVPRQSGTPQSTSSSLSCFSALPYFFVPHALITNWGR